MKLNFKGELEMPTNKEIIEQIRLLAEQLGGEVTGATCYDSKNEWKKLTIEYDLSLIHISEPTRPY